MHKMLQRGDLMKISFKLKAAGGCIVAFGVGIITACLLPWAAVSFAVALVAVAAGILLFFN